MADRSFLNWPFFEDRHREFAARIEAWAAKEIGYGTHKYGDLDSECRRIVRILGEANLIEVLAPSEGPSALDVRTICIARETLARYSGLFEVMFVMQGLGTGPITLFADAAIRERYLPGVRSGNKIAAFALSEPEAGSDVASMSTTATRVAGGWRIDGIKTWISNGGIADHYVLFARTGEAPGAKGISAFVVDADTPGFSVVERLDVISPHPIAKIKFDNCVIPADRLLSTAGDGFKVAMATLDVFRTTVAAAALGFGRRALDESVQRAATRMVMGKPLIEQQLIQGKIADMACAVDASALLVYRSAWTRDVQKQRVTRESSIAKLYSTEAVQHVVDEAVQIFGGMGVTKGSRPEELYRDIRALRIYEGASEVQRVIIARQTMSALMEKNV
jgi:acyl-CoA dehydrogenase